MNNPINIYHQPLIIVSDSEPPSNNVSFVQDDVGNYTQTVQVRYDTVLKSDYRNLSEPDTIILETPLSSVPVVLESELNQEYQELGQALTEMTELDERDEWRIDAPVYMAACNVAAGLRARLYPAPRVFTHGPKSVVFNWSKPAADLYLTVSADKVSALLSSPERIERRIEVLARNLGEPSFLLSALTNEPLRLTGAVFGPTATERL